MPTVINLPGGATGTFGPALGVTSGSFYTDQYNVVFPNAAAGVRRNLSGNYLIRIHSIDPDRFSPAKDGIGFEPDNAIWWGPASGNYRPGETITSATDPQTLVQLRIFYNGTQPSWYRNNDGLGRCTDRNINTGALAYTYPGSIAGTWSWATVPTIPTTISTSTSGTSVTVTRGTSTSDASYPVTSYTVERRESNDGVTFGSWSNAVSMPSSTYTYTGLTAAKYYQFRVYAANSIGTSQAVASSTTFIAAVTRYSGTAFVLLSKLKRHNGTSWTNITSAKRWNGTAWQTIDISSIPNT